MTPEKQINQTRRGSRFVFVSKVKYVLHADVGGKEYQGLAFNVSIDGICISVNRRLEVGEEIVITECILPYCRRRYKVRWTDPRDSATYKVGLSRNDKAAS
jgi:hypothetical protein